jgi:hypothetical protein
MYTALLESCLRRVMLVASLFNTNSTNSPSRLQLRNREPKKKGERVWRAKGVGDPHGGMAPNTNSLLTYKI